MPAEIIPHGFRVAPPTGNAGAADVNPFSTGNPFSGTKLLGFSIGRGSGALKGLRGY